MTPDGAGGAVPERRVLVTGASGFVGAAVARALAARPGVRVRALVRATSPRENLRELELEEVRGDLTDVASLRAAVRGCDSVFHVAADYRIWVPDPGRMMAVNVEGTRALARAAADAGVRRFVYTSSVATLGLPVDGSPGDETTPVALDDMVGTYKRSKFLAERALEEEAQATGLDICVLHPTAPVGPGDVKPTPTGRTILDAALGRMPAYVDTGLNVVHVDDVALGHLLAWDLAPAGRHFVLGSENLALRDILSAVSALVSRPGPRVRLRAAWLWPLALGAEAWAHVSGREPRLVRDALRMSRKRMFFSSRRAEEELGYRPRPAHAAFLDALRWFHAAGLLDRAPHSSEQAAGESSDS